MEHLIIKIIWGKKQTTKKQKKKEHSISNLLVWFVLILFCLKMK